MHGTRSLQTRSAVRITLLAVCLFILPALLRAELPKLVSPHETLRVHLGNSADGRLTWSLERSGKPIFAASPLGITVDSVDLGQGSEFGRTIQESIEDEFVVRGGKRQAKTQSESYHIFMHHKASNTDWVLELRLFDDAFAWRYRIPGQGARRIVGESSAWTMPATAEAWYQTGTNNYEGEYKRAKATEILQQLTTDRGSVPALLGPPVTLELEGGLFALITEANLRHYSGMKLRRNDHQQLEAVFDGDPDGFALDGEIVTPWRVTLVVADLQGLANSDVVPSLCDRPDPKLFPEGGREEWIRSGRALVTWCVFGNDGAQWHLQKWFVDQCAALHCEFLLLDGGWRSERWGFLARGADEWARLKELCEYGKSKGVGIVVWHSFPEGREDSPGLVKPEARDEFFQRCHEAGVQGVKIDFFDSESLATVEAWENLTRRAAEHHLTINFHGSNKSTGEYRTWPNHITHEGIREQEYVLWDKLSREHYAVLPFTRLATGHGDFLPGYVRGKFLKNTLATFQMGTSIIATSPFLCWPDHPEDYRASVFLGFVQAIPTLWDETHVLTGSTIGRRVAFARRAGDQWFVAALNCQDEPTTWELDLKWLGDGLYSATTYLDQGGAEPRVLVNTEQEFTRDSVLKLDLPPGGGFIGWLKPSVKPK